MLSNPDGFLFFSCLPPWTTSSFVGGSVLIALSCWRSSPSTSGCTLLSSSVLRFRTFSEYYFHLCTWSWRVMRRFLYLSLASLLPIKMLFDNLLVMLSRPYYLLCWLLILLSGCGQRFSCIFESSSSLLRDGIKLLLSSLFHFSCPGVSKLQFCNSFLLNSNSSILGDPFFSASFRCFKDLI